MMKQITLYIPENKYPFFMELIKNLNFIRINEESLSLKEKEAFVNGTKKSLDQVEKHLKGEIKLKTADQLYEEL